jgi:hypothetical protein
MSNEDKFELKLSHNVMKIFKGIHKYHSLTSTDDVD